jgi:hypothetical protein
LNHWNVVTTAPVVRGIACAVEDALPSAEMFDVEYATGAVKTTVVPSAIVWEAGWAENAIGFGPPDVLTVSVAGRLVAKPAVFVTVTE